MVNLMRLAALAAVLVVAVAGITYFLPGNGGFGGLQPSPAPTPTPRPVPREFGPLTPGNYITPDPFPMRITFTLPPGWEGNTGGPNAVWLDQTSGRSGVAMTIFDKVYADPCHSAQGLLDPVPGPSVDELANALANLPSLDVTTPTDVSVDGYQGKHLTMTAPASSAGCTLAEGQFFRVWELPLGARNDMRPGERDEVWILDVDGQRLVLYTNYRPGHTAADQAEVQGILDSIRIAPLQPADPSAAPTP